MPAIKIQTKWIKNERALHKREMGNPLSTDSERAASYALWLARRDGYALPDEAANYLHIVWDKVNGKKRAKAARFYGVYSGIVFEFPHWDYVERGAIQLPDAPDDASA
jgi:hypothetical protein